jgi:hypothetical protein
MQPGRGEFPVHSIAEEIDRGFPSSGAVPPERAFHPPTSRLERYDRGNAYPDWRDKLQMLSPT